MECDYTSCVWNDSYKWCIKPKSITCPRPLLEKMKKQQTNADRIRAMSDEELAEYLCDKILTKEMWMEWLKQPVEVQP